MRALLCVLMSGFLVSLAQAQPSEAEEPVLWGEFGVGTVAWRNVEAPGAKVAVTIPFGRHHVTARLLGAYRLDVDFVGCLECMVKPMPGEDALAWESRHYAVGEAALLYGQSFQWEQVRFSGRAGVASREAHLGELQRWGGTSEVQLAIQPVPHVELAVSCTLSIYGRRPTYGFFFSFLRGGR